MRTKLKEMGQLSTVSIEPDEQTLLADNTLKIAGVMISAIPGGKLLILKKRVGLMQYTQFAFRSKVGLWYRMHGK